MDSYSTDRRDEDRAARQIVLLRHGESTANLDGTFAGWNDVALTPAGVEQATQAGRLLQREGFAFDLCYTSALARAIDTARLTLEAIGTPKVPVVASWRLNERHYGALQGLDRQAVERLYGKAQVALWRRGYAARPPRRIDGPDDAMHGRGDAASGDMPWAESMHDTVMRVLPFWRDTLASRLRAGARVLVVAHGTTFRAFARLVGGLEEDAVERVEAPNATPFICELDAELRVVRAHFHGDGGAQPGGWFAYASS